MPMIAQPTTLDPLRAFREGAFVRGSERPVPLVETRFDVRIEAGLASVTTTRVFRNAEPAGIEATITFPVPVQATLFALTARIDGRLLRAKAQPKARARETYEDAIERGKAAVLHEEVLRGVHMLSVAHIAPGAEIEVSATWAMPLDGRGRLRIPLTVGDIYGRSPLPDPDDLVHGGPSGTGELRIRCDSGTVSLVGADLQEGRARIRLDAPIDLLVTGWTPRPLRGRAADGRAVVVRIEPAGTAEAALDVALLVDRSGSMQEVCAGDGSGLAKHAAVRVGIDAAAATLREGDAVDLFEFDDRPARIGSTGDLPAFLRSGGVPARLRELAAQLGAPRGGTEIGAALQGVLTGCKARDVVLVTDGKSHALDVQALAGSGRRFSVVLVGEDSLEANVGHLAAMTGGDVFVVTGADLTGALLACLAALRHPAATPATVRGRLHKLALRRNGHEIAVEWRDAAEGGEDGRAVAAFAAGLAVPLLEPEAAAALAAAEGLVTHLTSLVLVDEAGVAQEGQPAARRVPLPTPRTALAAPLAAAHYAAETFPAAARMPAPAEQHMPGSGRRRGPPVGAPPRPPAPARSPSPAAARRTDLSHLARQIDWALAPQQLREGDLSALRPDVQAAIRAAAAEQPVVVLAGRLRIAPVVLVLALLARTSADRSAARLAKSVLGDRPPSEVKTLAAHFGLGRGSLLGWLRRGGEPDERPSR